MSGDLVRRGVRATDEERSEFLASTDNWFRPVAFANAPDGNLWFADIYREVIEHPWALPEPLKKHLDLNQGNDRGRLYRLVPENHASRPAPNLGKATTAELVALLDHANGWHRDTAARLLHERQDKASVPGLITLVEKGAMPASRLGALQVLRGLSSLDAATLGKALQDKDPDVRAGAVRLSAMLDVNAELVASQAGDPSTRVRAEVAWALVPQPIEKKHAALVTLLDRADEPWLRHATLAATGDAIEPVLTSLADKNPKRVAELRQLFGAKKVTAAALPTLTPAGSRKEAIAMYSPALNMPGDAGKGRATFETRCAVCHRFGGRGTVVGPDLDAGRLSGREKLLGNILEPSREITAGYALGHLETKAGETVVGILANETEAGVTLRVPGGVDRVVRRSEIAKVERPLRSLMPEGLEAGLSTQEMADLLEFLTSGGTAAP